MPGAATILPVDDVRELPSLALSDITSVVAKKKDTVTVKGLVTNTTDATLDGITVRLRYNPYPLTGRDALDRHADGAGPEPYASGPSTTIDTPLPPDSAISSILRTTV